jgi:hypothetical protein
MLTVSIPKKTFIERYTRANPFWANDYIFIAMAREQDYGNCTCPLTGANLYVRRRGFMLDIRIGGHGDGSDAERTRNIMLGREG